MSNKSKAKVESLLCTPKFWKPFSWNGRCEGNVMVRICLHFSKRRALFGVVFATSGLICSLAVTNTSEPLWTKTVVKPLHRKDMKTSANKPKCNAPTRRRSTPFKGRCHLCCSPTSSVFYRLVAQFLLFSCSILLMGWTWTFVAHHFPPAAALTTPKGAPGFGSQRF